LCSDVSEHSVCSIFIGGVEVFIQEEGFGSKIFLSQTFLYKYPNNFKPLFLLLAPAMKIERSVLKRWYVKFRHRGITQKKEYSIQNTAEVLNQE
jgi:hypothetical protein